MPLPKRGSNSSSCPRSAATSLLEVIQEQGHAAVFACLGVMILGLVDPLL